MTTPAQQPAGTAASTAASSAELNELRDEVDRLRRQLADREREGPARPTGPRRSWGRTFWSAVLVVVACLLAPLSIVAVWARGEVTDTDRYVATVAPLASDPVIQDAAATRITNEIFNRIDIEGLTSDAIGAISSNRSLTPRQTAALQALAVPLNNGIKSYTGNLVDQVVRSEAFAAAWTKANTIAHQQLQAALSGQDQGALTVANNQVSVNLGDIITEVKSRLVADGFTVADKIPAIDAQFVIFESDGIGRLQAGYALLDTLGYWLPFIALAIGLLGVLLANDHRIAFVGLGAGLTAAMLVAALLAVVGRTAYLNALPGSVNTAAATAVFDTLTYYLRQALWAGAVAGVVLILGGILVGPSRFGSGVRSLSSRAAGGVQRTLSSWGADLATVRRWVAERASGLRIAATVAAIAVVMLQRYKTPGLVLWTTAGLLVVLFVIQILASGPDRVGDAAGEARSPDGPATEPPLPGNGS